MNKFLEKLKGIKHIEIYISVVLIIVIVAIYFSVNSGDKTADEPQKPITASDYSSEIEKKLVALLSEISNIGEVSVMVSTEGTSEPEIAYEIEEKETTQKNATTGAETTTKTTTKTPYLKDGEPVIIANGEPKITGVVVVASGAASPAVRLSIERAVRTLIVDDGVKIEILF
ncbi:MAG: hypothetical protein LBM01_02045 [Christensenellaceae bacterium]|jgi:stage III sporulation protein AG|nr:hypothetical protein [Christensenellaceae bacterium]